MNAKILDWTASSGPMQLKIKVGVEPFDMTKIYIWKYGGTSAATWNWHYENGEQEVIGNNVKDILTQLVRQHPTLSLLLNFYRIPQAEE